MTTTATDRFFFYAACLATVGVFFLSIRQQLNSGPKTVRCTVERVVDDESDEPVANEQYSRSYSVLSHQPAWSVFTVPGDLGEPGKYVHVVPPVAE